MHTSLGMPGNPGRARWCGNKENPNRCPPVWVPIASRHWWDTDLNLAVLCPEGEQPLGKGLVADRRHLRPGQDEALQGGLDDAIP